MSYAVEFKNPEGFEICHPFGILFRNLYIFYNHINPSDLKNSVIGFQLRNSQLN